MYHLLDNFFLFQMFKTEITFLTGNNYPDLHHSQGDMKFATQISPLLNLFTIIWIRSTEPAQFNNQTHFNHPNTDLVRCLDHHYLIFGLSGIHKKALFSAFFCAVQLILSSGWRGKRDTLRETLPCNSAWRKQDGLPCSK